MAYPSTGLSYRACFESLFAQFKSRLVFERHLFILTFFPQLANVLQRDIVDSLARNEFSVIGFLRLNASRFLDRFWCGLGLCRRHITPHVVRSFGSNRTGSDSLLSRCCCISFWMSSNGMQGMSAL